MVNIAFYCMTSELTVLLKLSVSTVGPEQSTLCEILSYKCSDMLEIKLFGNVIALSLIGLSISLSLISRVLGSLFFLFGQLSQNGLL